MSKSKYKEASKAMKVQATLALTYPPGYLFHMGKFFKKGYKMPTDFCKEFGVHGVFEPFWMKTYREKKDKTKHQFHFSGAFIKRLSKAMHYVDSYKAQSIIDGERRKHGKNLKFLTFDSYPVFAVELYEKHLFNEMLSFVFTELKRTQVNVWEYSLFGEDWIGIRLKDLAPICESYPPICVTNAERKLTLRVLDSDVYKNHFVLYEMHVGVSVDGELYEAGPVAHIFEEEKDCVPLSPDSIILLCNVLNF